MGKFKDGFEGKKHFEFILGLCSWVASLKVVSRKVELCDGVNEIGRESDLEIQEFSKMLVEENGVFKAEFIFQGSSNPLEYFVFQDNI